MNTLSMDSLRLDSLRLDSLIHGLIEQFRKKKNCILRHPFLSVLGMPVISGWFGLVRVFLGFRISVQDIAK